MASGYGPAVTGGVIQYVSPSSINTHTACNLKYWFKYVLRAPDDAPSKAMAFGVAAHGRIERYLLTGEDLLGPAERAAINYIPEPSPDLLVEKKTFEGVPLLAAGIPVNGSMDLTQVWGQIAKVTDWKTTSRLSNKTTTEKSLADPHDADGRQMLAYAEWVRRNYPNVSRVELQHVQIQIGTVTDMGTAGGPFKANSILATTSAGRVAAAWATIEAEYVEPMKATAAATRPEDVRGNPEFCHAYHRNCAFIAKCPVGKAGRPAGALGFLFTKPQGEQPMSMIDQMKQLTSAPAATAAKAIVEATPSDAYAAEFAAPVPATAPPSEKFEIRVAGYSTTFTAPPTPPQAIMEAPAPAAEAPVKRAPARARKPDKDTGWALYVNCYPNAVATASLYPYVLELEKKALAAVGETLPDIRLSAAKEFSYNRYKAVLATLAKETPPPGGNYAVQPGADERIDAVVTGLESIAAPGDIVRGGGR